MKTLINIKADRDVKIKAQKTAEELGLSLSAVINAYLKQFVRNKAVFFSTVPQMTPELERLAGQAEKDYKHKKNIVGPFKTAAEIAAYLDA